MGCSKHIGSEEKKNKNNQNTRGFLELKPKSAEAKMARDGTEWDEAGARRMMGRCRGVRWMQTHVGQEE